MADKPDSAEPESVKGRGSSFKPVLGLSDEPGELLAIPVRTGTVYDQPGHVRVGYGRANLPEALEVLEVQLKTL